jgi:hypothetical protein
MFIIIIIIIIILTHLVGELIDALVRIRNIPRILRCAFL